MSADDTPGYAGTLANLAGILDSQSRSRRSGGATSQQALEIRRKTLDANHPDVNESVRGMAQGYNRLGRVREAEMLLREQLAVLQAKPPEDDGEEAMLLAELGKSLFEQGRGDEAESHLVVSVPRVMQSTWVRPKIKVNALEYAIDAFERSGDSVRAAGYRASLDSLKADSE